MQHYLLAILIITLSPLVLASNSFSNDDLNPLFRKRDLNPEEKAEFQKQYLVGGYARNFPTANANHRFTSGIPHPYVGYRFFINNHWAVGVSGQFKFLFEKESGENLVLATISQESYYLYRLYYPIYLEVGGKLQYLSPVRKGMLPLQRHPDYALEIGAALSAGMIFQINRFVFSEFRIDRWRGTKTMKLHGLEFSLGLGYHL